MDMTWVLIAAMVVLFLYIVVYQSADLLVSMWTISLQVFLLTDARSPLSQVWTGKVAVRARGLAGEIRNWVYAALLPSPLPPALRAAEAVHDLMEEASRCMLEECKLEQQCWQDILLGITAMRRRRDKKAALELLDSASLAHQRRIQVLESKTRLWRERLRSWLHRGCEVGTLDVHILRYDSSIRRHSQNEYPTAADVGMESTGATGENFALQRYTDVDAIHIALLEAREVKDDVADATASPRGPPADERSPRSPKSTKRWPSPASPAPAPEASDRRRFRVTSHPKYRTVLCQRYMEGACTRNNCAFAHGEEALRQQRFPQPPTDASPAADSAPD
eukprot:TRINITY_DN368_c0_g1_i3.p1 TRINITY_DN368_c0_g1~~TRINITY_DN368_c0_g1_i3.p1  ORF type:complete len:335 (+),score=41.16 TRINITY_DN368_c0_g1_i3:92-1096(+)